ncbi:hypothetical protein [Flavobacterium sp. TBRC 19031]|uniref:hypothetical protein n=1 Tax=Flavobacterium mekongense TaxID=3379707 RepID=UPI00399B114C
MKIERSNVNFPIWRKKVDKTVLKLGYTPIPSWVLDLWKIKSQFQNTTSKKDITASVSIQFKHKTYIGFISKSKRDKGRDYYRLYIGTELCDELKSTFVMSYMRSIEQQLRESSKNSLDVEKEIPFWEFLDIEYDNSRRIFYFTAYYTQGIIFPRLFTSLIKSTALKQFEKNDDDFTITKSGWLEKSTFINQFNANNVIYYLIDTKKKLLYIGETDKLVERFKQGHNIINDWEYYRYDILPKSLLKKQRVALERMLIACFATLLSNDKNNSPIFISNYKLVNKKIDYIDVSSLL